MQDIPRVSTPRVVDFPLSTFPTTAHRTSGVRETFRGGNRKSRVVRARLVRVSNRTEVFPGNCIRYTTNMMEDILYLPSDLLHGGRHLFL
jgi:hypothetical protein